MTPRTPVSPAFSNAQSRPWGTVGLLGLALLAASAALTPQRAWASGLLVAYYLVTLGLGGLAFIAMANVIGAGWHVAIRRVPEAFVSLIPFGGLLMLALLAMQHSRYAWHPHSGGDAGTFWFKELWLKPTFFGLRAVGYLAVWCLFAWLMVGASRRQDRLASVASQRLNTATSAVFLAVFAITISLASVDWIMALEPMWFSTMWGVYHFAGLFEATLAALIIACILLRRGGPMLGIVRDEHLHDLGKLLLGFSCFWMYIWFCQYMLIWYSNIPEETVYFAERISHSWGPMIVASLVLNWGIPFCLLLPRENKRSETVMLRVSAVVLLGRWIDLSVMIYPPVLGDAPPLGIPEVAGASAAVGLTVWLFSRAFRQANPAPARDPLFAESMTYH